MSESEVGQDEEMAELVRDWRDRLETTIKPPSIAWKMVHAILDEMDEFLGEKKP